MQEINFASLKLEKAVGELAKLNDVAAIVEHLKNLKNLKIDTSSFENKMDQELAKIQNKIENITDKIDLHELDEIDTKLKVMSKKIKPQRFISLLFVAFFAFSSGALFSYLYLQNTQFSANELGLLKVFKNQNYIKIGQKNEFQYIYVSNQLKTKESAEGTYYLLQIQKQGN
ncbi:MAG: hypothetical protein WC694_03485 [Candidatus Paceibacterota bacterium]